MLSVRLRLDAEASWPALCLLFLFCELFVSRKTSSRRFSFRHGIRLNERSGFAVAWIPDWGVQHFFGLHVFLRSESPETRTAFFTNRLPQCISSSCVGSDHQDRERVDGRFGKVATMAIHFREHGIALCLRRGDLMNSGRRSVLLQIEDFRVTSRCEQKRGIGSTNQTGRGPQEGIKTESFLW